MPIERYGDDDAQRRLQAEARAAGQEVKEGVREAGREGARHARSFLDRQRDAAAERVHGLADALRRTSLGLDDDGASDLTARFADQAEHLSEALRERDVDALRRDAERFGRRHPGALFGGAFAAGLALSRFLKSSSPSAEEDDFDAEEDGSLASSQPGEHERDVPRPHPQSVSTAAHVTRPAADLPARENPETPRTWR